MQKKGYTLDDDMNGRSNKSANLNLLAGVGVILFAMAVNAWLKNPFIGLVMYGFAFYGLLCGVQAVFHADIGQKQFNYAFIGVIRAMLLYDLMFLAVRRIIMPLVTALVFLLTPIIRAGRLRLSSRPHHRITAPNDSLPTHIFSYSPILRL